MIETLSIVGISALGIAMVVHSIASSKRRRREIEYSTGGRYSEGLAGKTLEVEHKGLSLTIRLNEGGESEHDETATVSLPVSLSPSADFYVGPKNPFTRPIGRVFTSLPALAAPLPGLAGLQARGEPEKAAVEVLSRIESLDAFRKAGMIPTQLACSENRLELVLTTRGRFGAGDLKRLMELSADLAFKLMG